MTADLARRGLERADNGVGEIRRDLPAYGVPVRLMEMGEIMNRIWMRAQAVEHCVRLTLSLEDVFQERNIRPARKLSEEPL